MLSPTRRRGAGLAIGAPTRDTIREQLARIVSSSAFLKSGRVCRLLEFLVEETLAGRGDRLKEYSLGLAVFERGENFDPRVDSVVRVEVSRLRLKLQAYYAREGREDPVVIELPRGGYVPSIARRAAAPARASKRRWLAFAALVLALAAAWWIVRSRPSEPARIAVLAFRDLSAEREFGYLCQGMAEEVAIALSKVDRVEVLGRPSVPETREDVAALGKELEVSAVVAGSVRKAGNRLRVTARLVAAGDGRQLWGEVYETDPKELPGLEDQIAGAVARALKLRVSPARRGPRNAEAQILFWRGRYLRSQRTPESVLKSADYFGQAIAQDPQYAAAHSALADVHSMLGFHGLEPVNEAIPKARSAVARALELDPGLPEAHGVLAWIRFVHDWDWAGAEREFARSLELNPSYAAGRQCHAFLLAARGRCGEAVAESRRALALDPLSYVASNDLGMLLYYCRRYGDAMRQARMTLEMRAHAAPPHVVLGSSLAMQGRPAEAIAEFRAIPPSDGYLSAMGRLGYAYAAAGRRQEAHAVLAELRRLGESGQQTSTQMAFVNAGLGETGAAIRNLEEGWQRREGEAVFLCVEPMLETARAHPGWRALRQKCLQ